jgi:hypothetical protein
MKRAIVVLAALSLGVVSYAGVAAGTGTSESHHRHHQRGVRVLVGTQCNITVLLKGFRPGTFGRIQVMSQEGSATIPFRVRSPMFAVNVPVRGLFSGPSTPQVLNVRIMIQGHVMSGSVAVNCPFAPKPKNPKTTINVNVSGGGGGGAFVSTAGAAAGVTSQPGFAG